jgi:hypothetical protein
MYKLLSVSNRKEIIHKTILDSDNPQKGTVWFKNGFLYRGDLYENRLHGNGLLLLGDGSYYLGESNIQSNSKASSKRISSFKESGFTSQDSFLKENFTKIAFRKELFIFLMETHLKENGQSVIKNIF